MSVDREYKIRITTVTDGNPGQTAEGLNQVGKAAEKGGEGMKFFEFHGGEFKKLLHELDGILPGIGVAIKAVFNPATLGLGAGLFLFERAKEALVEYNQKLDEAGEAAAKADFAGAIQAALEATRDAVSEQEKYIANLHEIEKGEHGVAVELNNQLQLIAAIEAARQQKAEADHTLALARVKEQEVNGTLSPTQAALQRKQIEDNYILEKRRQEERKFQEEQKARLDAAAAANNQQTQLDQKRTDTANALAEAKKKQNTALEARPAKEDLAAAQKALEEANEKARVERESASANPSGRIKEYIDQAEFEADLAKRRYDDLQQRNKLADEAQKTNLTPLQIAADEARKEALANAQGGAANRAAANQAQAQHDATAGDRDATTRDQFNTDAFNTRGDLMGRARTLQKQFQNEGPAFSKQDAAELAQLIQMLGERFFEMGENRVTKQEFDQEKMAIRRLLEKKGK